MGHFLVSEADEGTGVSVTLITTGLSCLDAGAGFFDRTARRTTTSSSCSNERGTG
jgi:hypothetical protein